jgi:hypothetical protein
VSQDIRRGILAKSIHCKILERKCVTSQVLCVDACSLYFVGREWKTIFKGLTSGVIIFIYSLLVTVTEAEALFPGKDEAGAN